MKFTSLCLKVKTKNKSSNKPFVTKYASNTYILLLLQFYRITLKLFKLLSQVSTVELSKIIYFINKCSSKSKFKYKIFCRKSLKASKRPERRTRQPIKALSDKVTCSPWGRDNAARILSWCSPRSILRYTSSVFMCAWYFRTVISVWYMYILWYIDIMTYIYIYMYNLTCDIFDWNHKFKQKLYKYILKFSYFVSICVFIGTIIRNT